MYTVSITSQGQISLPAKIREEFGFKKASKAIISVQGGKVIIEPVGDLLSLKGSLKTDKKALTSKEISAAFEDYVKEDYEKSNS